MTTEVQQNTFNAALPYGIATLSMGMAGILGAVTIGSTGPAVFAITGLALAIIGASAFLGVTVCALVHRNNPDAFRNSVMKFMAIPAGIGTAVLIGHIASAILSPLMSAL